MAQTQVSLNKIYEMLLRLDERMKKMDKYIEDLEFARRVEEAYQRHEAGEFIEKDENEFLKELKKW